MPKRTEQCTATIDDPKTGVRRTCNNPAVTRVTDTLTGSREFYCPGHQRLYEEFLQQADHDAARWRSVPQGAAGPG
jgi:hypothetical protein